MKGAFRKLVGMSAVFIAGMLLGPPLIALLAATPQIFDQQPLPWERFEPSIELFEVYQANTSDPFRFTLEAPSVLNHGAECGYDPNQVFEGGEEQLFAAREANQWVDLEGYILVWLWARRYERENYHTQIARELEGTFSRFETDFLRRCIKGTILAPICMHQVERVAARVDSGDSAAWHNLSGAGYENRVVCGYVDGVAARKNITLADQPD